MAVLQWFCVQQQLERANLETFVLVERWRAEWGNVGVRLCREHEAGGL